MYTALAAAILILPAAASSIEPAKTPISAKTVTPDERLELLSRARVWQPPPVAVSKARLETQLAAVRQAKASVSPGRLLG